MPGLFDGKVLGIAVRGGARLFFRFESSCGRSTGKTVVDIGCGRHYKEEGYYDMSGGGKRDKVSLMTSGGVSQLYFA
jgi:hypothetical protein